VNNYGVERSKGTHVLFLNNDTEVISGNWLESMLEHSQRNSIGAVGAKLLFPNNTIQHIGTVLKIREGATHVGVLYPEWLPISFPLLHIKDHIRNVSAVTAACLMVEKKKFNAVNGFDEKFKVAFNDTDLCLKLYLEKGWLNIYTPYAKLYHHESISLGRPYQSKKRSVDLYEKERRLFWEKWNLDKIDDPYYNPNLTLIDESMRIKV